MERTEWRWAGGGLHQFSLCQYQNRGRPKRAEKRSFRTIILLGKAEKASRRSSFIFSGESSRRRRRRHHQSSRPNANHSSATSPLQLIDYAGKTIIFHRSASDVGSPFPRLYFSVFLVFSALFIFFSRRKYILDTVANVDMNRTHYMYCMCVVLTLRFAANMFFFFFLTMIKKKKRINKKMDLGPTLIGFIRHYGTWT